MAQSARSDYSAEEGDEATQRAVEALRARGYQVQRADGDASLWDVEGQLCPLSARGVISLVAHVALMDAPVSWLDERKS